MWQSPPVQTSSPDLEVALLRQHVREKRVARDVERHAEEHVGAALVELAAQAPVRHVELEERMARHERHLRQVGDVPRAHDDAAGVGLLAQEADGLGDLIDVPPVRRRPAAPLHAVDRAEVAVLVGPLVPDRDAVLLQPADVPLAAQEPEQLLGDRGEVHLLRGDEREPLAQVEAHLVAEDADRARARAIVLRRARGEDVAHEVLVLRADRMRGRGIVRHVTDDSACSGGSGTVAHTAPRAQPPCTGSMSVLLCARHPV